MYHRNDGNFKTDWLILILLLLQSYLSFIIIITELKDKYLDV